MITYGVVISIGYVVGLVVGRFFIKREAKFTFMTDDGKEVVLKVRK